MTTIKAIFPDRMDWRETPDVRRISSEPVIRSARKVVLEKLPLIITEKKASHNAPVFEDNEYILFDIRKPHAQIRIL
jgi:hypothetical protein